MTLTTKLQRLVALRPLSPESVASLAAAWVVAADCIRPAKFLKVIEGMADAIRRHIPINFVTSGN